MWQLIQLYMYAIIHVVGPHLFIIIIIFIFKVCQCISIFGSVRPVLSCCDWKLYIQKTPDEGTTTTEIDQMIKRKLYKKIRQ